MSDLSKKYQEIIADINSKISDKEELGYVKNKLSEVTLIFVDLIEQMSGVVEGKIDNIEKEQKRIESKLNNIEETLSSIKKYVCEEDDMETEIVCPYCNKEFYADIEDEVELEIQCPECHNMIELDMNSDNIEDDFFNRNICSGHCGGCGNCNIKKDNEDN